MANFNAIDLPKNHCPIDFVGGFLLIWREGHSISVFLLFMLIFNRFISPLFVDNVINKNPYGINWVEKKFA